MASPLAVAEALRLRIATWGGMFGEDGESLHEMLAFGVYSSVCSPFLALCQPRKFRILPVQGQGGRGRTRSTYDHVGAFFLLIQHVYESPIAQDHEISMRARG